MLKIMKMFDTNRFNK